MGIINSGCLWASNASFLNDRRELIHGLHGAEQAIGEFIPGLDGELRKLVEKVIKEFKDGALPETYVTCFCEESDVLSQWRGYGGSDQGVCIKFGREALVRRLRADDAWDTKVIYSNVLTAKRVNEALRDEIAELKDWEETLGSQSPAERYSSVVKMVSKLLPRFKHYGFRDEREWRFVVQRPIEADSRKFRAARNLIVPYIEVGKHKSGRLPISSVTVGPGRDMEHTRQSLLAFLRAKGYPKVTVKISGVPFRD